MFLKTQINIDFEPLNELIQSGNLPTDANTRLMMNDTTVYALTGKHFYEDRMQSHHGFRIVENASCDVGEVIILVNYELMWKDN